MKYILLMTGTKAGVEQYLAWSQKDRDAHMAVLQGVVKDLAASGEFVATQGLAAPQEAKLVRGERAGMPVTDGVFPESKEFLLGYWILEVTTPERAYAIAGRIVDGQQFFVLVLLELAIRPEGGQGTSDRRIVLRTQPERGTRPVLREQVSPL
jgi:hypothetical protein